MGKLTARKAATAPPGKHDDGDGLRLYVSPSGARKWVYRFMLNGRRREAGLGSLSEISLAQAREKAADSRRLISQGIDPIDHKAPATVPTFTQCAARYIRAHRHGWSNPKHARQWVATLKTYARPILGAKPVDAIATEDILLVLKPIWTNKTETAKRVQGRIENVLDYATAHQYRDASNPARWRGHLDQLLARPSTVKTVEHHPAMPYDRLPEFLCELASHSSISALALQWLILTATRTGETIGARWEEIDQEAAIWTIPAVRMKAKREHRVPLTGAVLEILARLPRLDGHLYLFPGARHGKSVSNMALLQLMRGMGYGVGGNRGAYVPHGFRSSFRDWAGEVSSFPREIAEAALAHVLENKVEAAYQRGDLLLKRRKLMEAWADWCIKPLCKTSALQTGIDPQENADYLTQINLTLPYRELR